MDFFFFLVFLSFGLQKINFSFPAEENCHRNLQFVTWGVLRRRQSDRKSCHKMTSGDVSGAGESVWRWCVLTIENPVQGVTCRSTNFVKKSLY